MKDQAERFRRDATRNIRVILGTAACVILTVAAALGWLGWKLLSQEETLAQQQAHNRIEQSADGLLRAFLLRMTETESWLSRMGSTLHGGDATAPAPAGAIQIAFSRDGIETQPGSQLLYRPVPPPSRPFDAEMFADAKKLEFQTSDLKAAIAALSALVGHKDRSVRAEALLRLARVQYKSGQIAEALSTYENLSKDESISPDVGEPYGLIAKSKRCQLLADSKQEIAARQEAAALLSELHAGRWPLTKESYVLYHNNELHKLAGVVNEPEGLETKLAVAEAVEKLWDEWKLFQQSGSRSLTKHLHESGRIPVIAVLNANPERLAAVVYAGDSVSQLALEHNQGAEQRDLRVSIVDEHGHLISGSMPESNEIQTTRSLSAAELPWRFNVAGSAISSDLLPERRAFYIVTLTGIVLLVSLACYAMARGVIREAAAGRLQSDFVSAVSHEFRSPLTTLRQLTELLSEGRIHDETRRRLYFTTLQKETIRLYELVEDLLDFGRMDAGRRQYKIESIDFSELVRDGVSEYQRQANGNGHRIELNSNKGELQVNADREAMRRVVRNLLENAVKYSPDAETVWVETGCDGSTAVLRVRDEGIGIPPEERSRIFDKFVRGEAAKQACIQGTGIGLAMVKEIIRVHHGAIDVDSEVGRGSTFMVRLPLKT